MADLNSTLVRGNLRVIEDVNISGVLSAASIKEGDTALSSKYLGISAKAADSDLLDGHDSSYFINTSNIGSQSVNYANSAGSASSAGNADTVDNKHASDLVNYGGNQTGIGQNTPFSGATTWFDAYDGTNALVYNTNGVEWTLLGSQAPGRGYGTILKWGYNDTYIYMARKSGGSWLTNDWDKISAGYADSAGYATSAGSASSATTASSADYATSAGSASSATTASSADYATSAGSASSATTAASADYATSAGSATSAGYATSAGSASTADNISSFSSAPDSAYVGGKLSTFYSWNNGGPVNNYSTGITVGGNPQDSNYGWQMAQSLWSDDLYYRRYDAANITGGWTSWLKILNPNSGLSREPWWDSSDSHSVNDLGSGITFAYTAHGAPATGTLVSFAGIGGSCESYRLQIQGNYYSNQLFYRNRNGDNSTWNNWLEVITSGNIGSQNVDQVDGKHASDFVYYLGAPTKTPDNVDTITNPGGANAFAIRTRVTGGHDMGVFYLSDDNAYICNSSDEGYNFAVFDTDRTVDFSNANNAEFAVIGAGNGAKINGNVVIHAGNISSYASKVEIVDLR